MGGKRRRLLAASSVLAGIFLLGAAAFAGPGSKGLEEAATHVPAEVDLPSPEAHEAQGNEGGQGAEGEDNHGQCVSAVAGSDERAALDDGWRRGLLVSLVAQDETMVGEDCDFSAQLAQATDAEGPGGSEESEGQGNATSDQAKQDGKEFGQSKKTEHAPGS